MPGGAFSRPHPLTRNDAHALIPNVVQHQGLADGSARAGLRRWGAGPGAAVWAAREWLCGLNRLFTDSAAVNVVLRREMSGAAAMLGWLPRAEIERLSPYASSLS
jgi:hypothetical protein